MRKAWRENKLYKNKAWHEDKLHKDKTWREDKLHKDKAWHENGALCKRVVRSVCALAAAVFAGGSLIGCSLAREDMQTDASSDHMIGVLLTDEPLDLFDMDGYIDDHISEFSDGDEVTIDASPKYAGKLYAKIEKNNSKDPSDWEISFEGVKGFKFLSPLWTDEDGGSYYASDCDDEISDVNTNVNTSDEKEERSMMGTVYMLPNMIDDDIGYHVNPVYQTEDGKIYATEGGGSYSSGSTSEGEQFSVGLSSETTVTENGKKKTEKSSVTVKLAVMYEPVKIRVYQMDADNRVVKKDEYEPGKMPGTLSAEKGTEYLLIETEQKDGEGKTVMKREVYEKGQEEELMTYYPLDNGILSTQYTEVRF